jgi:outer membrane receptor protein involved in Fe transport
MWNKSARFGVEGLSLLALAAAWQPAAAQTPPPQSPPTTTPITQPEPVPSIVTVPALPATSGPPATGPVFPGATAQPGAAPTPTIPAAGQTPLPQITVTAPALPAPQAPVPTSRTAAQPRPATAPAPVPSPQPAAPPLAGTAGNAAPVPAVSPAEVLRQQSQALDIARANLQPKIGANTFSLGTDALQAAPQGSNASLNKVLLQAPGVSQDSAAGGDLHVRNEHANLGYRINGIILPDGVSGFGQLLDTGLVGSLSLVTGALPAQYGLRTSGLVDIQTKTGLANLGGTISVYGGGNRTLTPSLEYGGVSGRTEYFVTTRGLWNTLGLENPTAAKTAIHDKTEQGKAFGYSSTVLDPNTRITSLSGMSVQRYQIPNNPGQSPAFTAYGLSDFDSAALNQRQLERNFFGVVALQKKAGDLDLQVASFTRYSSVRFKPDGAGDVTFNGVASDVSRIGLLSGVQGDLSYKLNPAHTLRAGLTVSGEKTQNATTSTLLPVDADSNPIDAPFAVTDASSKLGWLFGLYVQDEWKITPKLTLNLGLRFDQMAQYVTANQVSPRASLEYKPLDGTVLHAGYARYFTPPPQSLAAPTNLALVAGTTQQPEVGRSDPVLPERSHYFDIGVDQRIAPGLMVGASVYLKFARDLLDDGQFGAAYVPSAFNYERAINRGVELKAKYERGGFRTYGNIAFATQQGTNIVSNQFLFSQEELNYIATHKIFTDHAQTVTASAGISYLWETTRFSADMIYGSGLRNGDFNTGQLPSYTQVNTGVSHEFKWSGLASAKPTTIRFDVVNVFDHVYQIRDGSGIGVFAPQYGPRRTFYVGLSQKF